MTSREAVKCCLCHRNTLPCLPDASDPIDLKTPNVPCADAICENISLAHIWKTRSTVRSTDLSTWSTSCMLLGVKMRHDLDNIDTSRAATWAFVSSCHGSVLPLQLRKHSEPNCANFQRFSTYTSISPRDLIAICHSSFGYRTSLTV
jgi:hypothetical protein